MHVMLVTVLSQMSDISMQVGLLTTFPLYTDTLLPPPSMFCVVQDDQVCEHENEYTD